MPSSPPFSRFQTPFTLIAIATVTAVLVGIGAWFAGIQYSRIRSQQQISELTDSQDTVTKLRVRLHEQEVELGQLKAALHPSGTAATVSELAGTRRQILQLQAEINSYQNIIDRDRKEHQSDKQLISIFATPGIQLFPLRGAEPTNLVAYALVMNKNRVLLIASNLPKLAADRDYQLWLFRKDEPTVVSGGVFDPDDANRAIVQFSNSQLATQIESVAITEEPTGGSASPAGKQILSSSREE